MEDFQYFLQLVATGMIGKFQVMLI